MNHETFPSASDAILYFWAIGDMHYRAHEQWRVLHDPRMQRMFDDLRTVWREEGAPAFCVSPGDIVDTGAPANYELAKREIAAHLDGLLFYPGIGNHEFHPENQDDVLHTAEEYCAAWGRPTCYAWTAGTAEQVVCIMLEQPNAYLPGMRRENPHVVFTQDALTFLDTTLAEHADRLALIFAHCPLHNTVLDRDPARNLDDDSLDPFFFVENSSEVRAILARHRNAALYISGHTHSGWGSPQLVFTETAGDHPMTHLNLMSPWYTGRHLGPRLNAERTQLEYRPDTPDALITFAVHLYPDQAVIRARDHRNQRWLAQWQAALR